MASPGEVALFPSSCAGDLGMRLQGKVLHYIQVCDNFVLQGTADGCVVASYVDHFIELLLLVHIFRSQLDFSTPDEVLDLQHDSQLHIISGGTRIVQHTAPDKSSPGISRVSA